MRIYFLLTIAVTNVLAFVLKTRCAYKILSLTLNTCCQDFKKFKLNVDMDITPSADYCNAWHALSLPCLLNLLYINKCFLENLNQFTPSTKQRALLMFAAASRVKAARPYCITEWWLASGRCLKYLSLYSFPYLAYLTKPGEVKTS